MIEWQLIVLTKTTNALVCEFVNNNKWNYDKLIQYYLLMWFIRSCHIPLALLPLHDVEDEFIWGPASNGRFTIKSTTNLQAQKTWVP